MSRNVKYFPFAGVKLKGVFCSTKEILVIGRMCPYNFPAICSRNNLNYEKSGNILKIHFFMIFAGQMLRAWAAAQLKRPEFFAIPLEKSNLITFRQAVSFREFFAPDLVKPSFCSLLTFLFFFKGLSLPLLPFWVATRFKPFSSIRSCQTLAYYVNCF